MCVRARIECERARADIPDNRRQQNISDRSRVHDRARDATQQFGAQPLNLNEPVTGVSKIASSPERAYRTIIRCCSERGTRAFASRHKRECARAQSRRVAVRCRKKKNDNNTFQFLNGPTAAYDDQNRQMRERRGGAHAVWHFYYAAGPQTGVVLDVSPWTAMCVRNVDAQMCPAVHTMTRS